MTSRDGTHDTTRVPVAGAQAARAPLPALYYRARRAIAWSADRVTDWCDQQVRGTYGVGPPLLQRTLRAGLLATGSGARVAGLLPRLDVRLVSGPSWRVACVGDMTLLAELVRAFVPDAPTVESLPRIPAWRLSADGPRLLERADLVVCALPALWPQMWRARAPWEAETPVFVEMVAPLAGTSLTEWLSGGAYLRLRRDIALAQRVGFEIRATRSRADLDWFCGALYEPHLRRRHGELSIIASAQSHWRDWIARNGHLLLLHLAGRPVAGVIVADHGATRFLGEEGLALELTGTVAGARAQTALRAAAISQALELGLRMVSLGRSRARLSDPGLTHKRRWRGVPRTPERSAYPHWTLLATSVPAALAAHIERLALLDLHDVSRTIRTPPTR
jgi:hypothetical protein